MNVENEEGYEETDERVEEAALPGEFEGGAAGGTSNVV
jgi:hypothetical protein